MRRYGLRDDQWERIEGLLPGREGHVGVTARDNRLFVRRCCTATEPAYRGVTCRSASVLRKPCIHGSAAGRRAACGPKFSST
jgi:hypothetical protein